MNKLRIGIVGAGPGGLILARCLHVRGIEAVLFERETSPSVRSQGGSLDMHAESGQFALACAGLTAEFKAIARYEDQQSRVFDKYGVLRFKDDSVEGKDRPEVDRGHLRQMLLDSLPEGMIRWGHELSGCVEEADGGYRLDFRDGAIDRFDLVVGADGAWSRIRPLLSAAKPIYSGILFVELGIDEVDVRFPELSRRMGRGLTFAIGDSKALIAHRDAHAHLGIYAALRVDEDWIAKGGLDLTSPESSRQSLAAHFVGWSPELVEMIDQSLGRDGDRMVPRPIYALPVGHRWERQVGERVGERAGVTLLGDAAHLMSPFGGDGANLAMQDGAELALGLAAALEGAGDWRSAVREFETAMFARAEPAAAGAWAAIQEVFSQDGLTHILETMESHRG